MGGAATSIRGVGESESAWRTPVALAIWTRARSARTLPQASSGSGPNERDGTVFELDCRCWKTGMRVESVFHK